MNAITRRIALTGLLAAAMLTAACNKTERPAYALTTTGKILGFDTAKPTKIKTEVSVTGLAANESLIQLSYRPANATFYCMTNQTRICTINPKTGAAVVIRTASFTTETLTNPVIDFNPKADVLRVVASEQNLRINPNDGTLTGTDTELFFDGSDVNDNRTPQIAALAYDRNEANASNTTLFALDVTTQSLVRIGSRNGTPDSPNTGRLFTVAKLSTSFTGNAGFDIEPEGDTAYAALAASGAGAVLYRIDLSGGNADRVDDIGKGDRAIMSLVVGPDDKSTSN
ncbi:MAG: DUF4394 domain-containing protein [Stagnimonas sp.]|nr:DUF4394 domain-containing protein [Stagnimonas sp.]